MQAYNYYYALLVKPKITCGISFFGQGLWFFLFYFSPFDVKQNIKVRETKQKVSRVFKTFTICFVYEYQQKSWKKQNFPTCLGENYIDEVQSY